MFYIISKIESVGDTVTNTPIGYTEDKSKIDTSCCGYDEWVKNNLDGLEAGTVTPNTYFESNGPSYNANWETTCVDGLDLTEITDFSFMEVL